MKPLFFLNLLLLLGCAQSNSQKKSADNNELDIGGPCEGCEAIHESPVPFASLLPTDTLPGFTGPGEKIHISGKVLKSDGRTPASGVIIYVYHTDTEGNYPKKGDETGWAKRHGYLRGWMKTDENGFYQFYTIRPASYPNSSNPQHIHAIIKEAGIKEYYIDDFHFSDDPLLSTEMRNRLPDRGGSGILTLQEEGEIMRGRRDIVLGKNVGGS